MGGCSGGWGVPAAAAGSLLLQSNAIPPTGYTYTGRLFDRLFPWTTTTLNSVVARNSCWASYQGICYQIGGDQGAATNSINATISLVKGEPFATVNVTGVPVGYQYSAAESDGAGLIFVCGGANHAAVAVADLYVFTIAGATWATPTAMPGVRWKHCAQISGAFMYVFGGADNGPALVSPTYRLSLGGGTWQTTTALMPTLRINPRCGAVNGKIYVIGGNTTVATVAPTAVVECYDVASDTWSTKSPLPIATSEGQIITSGNLIWYMGGQINAAGAYATTRKTWIYDTVSDVWYAGPNLAVGRSGGCVGISGTDVFIARGQTIIGTAIGTTEIGIFPQVPSYLMVKT